MELKAREMPANLSTVYRIMDVLNSNNMLQKLNITGGKSLYEYNRMVHRHHLLCLGCKRYSPWAGARSEILKRIWQKDLLFDSGA